MLVWLIAFCEPSPIPFHFESFSLSMQQKTPAVPMGIAQLLRAHGLFGLVLASWMCSVLGAFISDGLLAWSAGLFYVAYDTWLLGYVAWKTRDLMPESAPAQRAANPPSSPSLPSSANHPVTLAVMISARNEAAMLPVCLRALFTQTDAPDEILVIDDGSTDTTLAVLTNTFGLTPSAATGGASVLSAGVLRVLSKPNGGKARALNDGLALIESDIVVTLDADTIVEPEAIAAMRRAFAQDPHLVATCGVLKPRCAPGFQGRVFEWFQTFEYLRAFLSRVAWMRIDALLLVSGAFAGYRRNALERVGGYRADSRVEDYELIHRMHRTSHDQERGWHIRVVSDARAVTDAPGSLSNFLRQRQRWFAGFLETLLANRDMVGSPRYGAVGRLMLPLKMVDTLQPLFGLTAFVLLLYFGVAQQPVLWVVLAVILVKLGIDVLFHLWSVFLYHRWLGQPVRVQTWGLALSAAFAEPFSFQLLRHLGAIVGWSSFLNKRTDWHPQRPTQQSNMGPLQQRSTDHSPLAKPSPPQKDSL